MTKWQTAHLEGIAPGEEKWGQRIRKMSRERLRPRKLGFGFYHFSNVTGEPGKSTKSRCAIFSFFHYFLY
jgi:hypothetical protein